MKTDVAAHVQQFFHRNKAVVIKGVAIGRGHYPIGIFRVERAVGAYGQMPIAVDEARIAGRIRMLFQVDDLRQHLTGDHVLHIAQVTRIHDVVVPFGRGKAHMAEIGIKVVMQIIHRRSLPA